MTDPRSAHANRSGEVSSGRWERQVLPRAINLVLSDRFTAGWRAKACAPATGRVLELGFGAGGNLAHYPETVTSVAAVEPSEVAWHDSERRRAEFGRPVALVSLDAAAVPLEDSSVDTVISTWTLCTIPDVTAALAEAMRVLKPSGRFRFVEHSAAPQPGVARFQRRIQPWWGKVAGGCHVDRDIPALLSGAGFDTSEIDARYASTMGVARPWSWFVSGSTHSI